MSDPAPGGRFRQHWHDEVASTNDLARELAEAGEPAGIWALARRQTAGRGRHGRAWQSPVGNFHGSLLLRPTCPLAEATTLSLVVGLAVAEALHDVTAGGVVPRLKWPNDVLIGPAKLAGILLEGGHPDTPEGTWVVVGVGANLAHHPALPGRATASLAGLGFADVTPEAFLDALDGPLATRLAAWEAGGFAALRGSWLDAAHGLGQEVTLKRGREEHKGRLADLGADGSILLESPTGCLERFTTGELFLG